jgi:hypothetical protein
MTTFSVDNVGLATRLAAQSEEEVIMDARLAFAGGSDSGDERFTVSRAPAHARCVTLAVHGLYYEHCEIGLMR